MKYLVALFLGTSLLASGQAVALDDDGLISRDVEERPLEECFRAATSGVLLGETDFGRFFITRENQVYHFMPSLPGDIKGDSDLYVTCYKRTSWEKI